MFSSRNLSVRHFESGDTTKDFEHLNIVDRYRFLLLPSLQREIFLSQLAARKEVSERDILDAYMTAYFNAWVDNHNLYGQKKYITAFIPNFITNAVSVNRFFEVYPQGRMMSIVRDPRDWYVSERNRVPDKFQDGDTMQETLPWQRGAQAILETKRLYGARVCVIRFKDLVERTEYVMRGLCDYLQINFCTTLLEPTFNYLPIKANSSFEASQFGILKSPVGRYKTVLTRKEIDAIDAVTCSLHESTLAHLDIT